MNYCMVVPLLHVSEVDVEGGRPPPPKFHPIRNPPPKFHPIRKPPPNFILLEILSYLEL